MSLDVDINKRDVIWQPITQRAELQELRDMLAITKGPNYWFNHFVTRAAGYETTRNGKGHCRRKPRDPRWQALTHVVTDLEECLRLVQEALPDSEIGLSISRGGDARAVIDDAPVSAFGATPSLTLSLAFVEALLRRGAG
jgi:hypothetical protein